MKEMRWRREGVVAIDDSLLPKTGRKMPGAGKLWDPNSKSYVHAQCLVTSHYVNLEKDYPVSFRQYFKCDGREAGENVFRSKVDLAMELVDGCERLGVAAENYVFDAWYLSERLTSHIEAYGKGWVSRLKANRIVYHEERRMTVKAFGETVPRQAFKNLLQNLVQWVYRVADKMSVEKILDMILR